jgi:hypothetical protein
MTTTTLNMIDRTTAALHDSHTFNTHAELMTFLRDDLAEGELSIRSVTAHDDGILIRFDSDDADVLDYVVTGIDLTTYNALADAEGD